MLGNYEEVSCTEWQGGNPTTLWNGSCMADDNAAFWPAVACGNQGTKHSLYLHREAVLVNVYSQDVHPNEWMAPNTA
jgi:hypothetical protein